MPKMGARVPMSHKWKATVMGLQFDVTGVENAPLAGPIAHYIQHYQMQGAHRAAAELPRMPSRSEQI